jgi:methyl-accepting chemotaxis protein
LRTRIAQAALQLAAEANAAAATDNTAEQSTGIDQIDKALTRMGEVTQQNSALVEENASSSKKLELQSIKMVAFFKLEIVPRPGRRKASRACRKVARKSVAKDAQ